MCLCVFATPTHAYPQKNDQPQSCWAAAVAQPSLSLSLALSFFHSVDSVLVQTKWISPRTLRVFVSVSAFLFGGLRSPGQLRRRRRLLHSFNCANARHTHTHTHTIKGHVCVCYNIIIIMQKNFSFTFHTIIDLAHIKVPIVCLLLPCGTL